MRRLLTLVSVCMLALGVTAPAMPATLPEVIELPDGFFPEGIAAGDGTTFYTGSLVDGAIYRGDIRSGDGAVLVPGVEGALAVGMDFDRPTGTLYVAGGPGAVVTAYDGDSGAVVGVAGVPGAFVNDLIVGDGYVFATDSFIPQLYAIPLADDGSFADDAFVIPLSGDFSFEEGQFNSNGIEVAPDGRLILVNSFFGELYTVDPMTGVATLIDLGGETVAGDGLVLIGRTLYAVVGSINGIVEIQLSRSLASGTVTDVITDDDFDVPTTAAAFGPYLYGVNAKFSTEPGPDVPYEVVQVAR
ncbi:MAG: superoxide dismutase [Acidimicrobiia bacterium]|nr:superoxide dismutase [Acidimicrobiia bacterium]